MRSIRRAIDSDLTRDCGALAVATAIVGASFGAIALAAGVPAWLAMTMSVLVFGGGSQFTAVAVLASGGSVITAVIGGLLLNARHLPLGLAVGDLLNRGWTSRLIGSHLLTDGSAAFTMAETDPRRRRITYWATGIALFVSWNLGVLVGVVAGQAIGDPDMMGLDAAFPAGLLALLLPSLRDRRSRWVAAGAVIVALAATP
ncbi:MAG: AzlC family ABC transporter permease, partial [Micromonosporaceae bacterium]